MPAEVWPPWAAFDRATLLRQAGNDRNARVIRDGEAASRCCSPEAGSSLPGLEAGGKLPRTVGIRKWRPRLLIADGEWQSRDALRRDGRWKRDSAIARRWASGRWINAVARAGDELGAEWKYFHLVCCA